MDTEQEFRIYCSEISKSLDTEKKRKNSKNQPLILEGVASTSDIDLEGDFITPQCIESFKLQATQCNIHNNHNVGLDDVIGTVLEVLDTDNKTLKIKFSILPLFREHIEECIDNGVKLGLSIGGTIVDYDMGDEGLKINSMMLHEISLTPLPANWNTMGTVVREGEVIEAKCLNGVCKQFLNNVEKTIETKETMEMEKRYYTKEEESQFMSEDTTVTEERVAEIIDEKLRDFVEQAKALEKAEKEAEIEKAKKEAEAKAKKEEEEEEEEVVEEEEEEEEEEKSKKEKSVVADLTPEELGSLIAQAVAMNEQKSVEPKFDFHEELKSLKEDIQSDIEKAMSTTKTDIEKNLFEGLMKESKPQAKADDVQLKKFLKTKSEKEHKDSSTLSVKDIAKTLARDE